ncbi:ATP-binding cassette domain-containing protein [Leucobacter chromiireducens]|uniref:ATP-binding cassette domain-containing protein n=1 Tax=Leucobacter chromiireducens TaxID=283877 RepID=UPI001F151E0E|nr:ABC transporter ATP-binding protein [Leucobacter chromiireducens]
MITSADTQLDSRGTAPGVSVSGLRVVAGERTLVAPVDFSVAPGELLAVIGESGSGKSMTARALTGLLPRGVHATGDARIDDHAYDLASGRDADWAAVRGRRAVLLLQDPFTSLSPVLRCGAQIADTIEARAAATGQRLAATAVRAEVLRRLAEVRLPERVARQYPSELSGGMRQRVAIAAALAADPRLLIADEPTTALDASTQGEVLDLLRELQLAHQMSLILISHDLGVIEGRADRVLVMRHGEVVERGDTAAVLRAPEHPYTRQLIAANLSVSDDLREPSERPAPLLEAEHLSKRFGATTALADATVSVAAGEVLAIVGESGSGKTTLARAIAGLERPDTGEVRLAGRTLPPGRRGRTPGEIQVVFQDPYSTLNPVFTIRESLDEALRAGGRGAGRAQAGGQGARSVDELLRLVELDPALADRRPAQLSGGQRQRVAIARALAPNPQVLICDESVSALDVSVQAQILGLLARLRDELQLAMLFITHDLGVVARIADRITVLRLGEIVEQGDTGSVLRAPQHPYTQLLVAAAERDSIARGHDESLPREERA